MSQLLCCVNFPGPRTFIGRHANGSYGQITDVDKSQARWLHITKWKNKWLTVFHRAEGDAHPLRMFLCKLSPDSHGVVAILRKIWEVTLGRGSVLALILEMYVTIEPEREMQESLVSGLTVVLFPVIPKSNVGWWRQKKSLLGFALCF